MPSGGPRANAGRKRGAPNKRTAATVEEVASSGATTPLMHLLSTMNDPNASSERRDRAAMTLLPYLHSRLSSVAWLPKSNFDLSDDEDGSEAERFVDRLLKRVQK